MKTSAFFKTIAFLALLPLFSCDSHDMPANDDGESAGKPATEITLEEARADLESLLLDLDGPMSRGGGPRRIKNMFSRPLACPASRSDASDSILVYIFNFEDNRGFAIMSGDERIPALIAISENGSLDEGTIVTNPGFGTFLNGMNNQIGAISSGNSNLNRIEDHVTPDPGGVPWRQAIHATGNGRTSYTRAICAA